MAICRALAICCVRVRESSWLTLRFVHVADALLDVVDGDGVFFLDYVAWHDFLHEAHVDVAVVDNGVGHEGVDDAFEVAHVVADVFGDVAQDVGWYLESFFFYFGGKDAEAEVLCGFFYLCLHSPLEACEQSVFESFDSYRRTVG